MRRRIASERYNLPTNTKTVAKHSLRIFNETGIRVPRKKIVAIYDNLLKKKYPLNIIFINDAFSRKLNKTYRKKNGVTNILTFPANDTPTGISAAEIYINMDKVLREAKKADATPTRQVIFLAIHGMLHLLGHKHGNVMEHLEDAYTKKFM